jgi:mannosyl-3-phosphoglycerate phosphatase
LVIFTDLDGTFLDHQTYFCDEALPAYRRCRTANVPVVFCSSKTRAEIEELRHVLSSAEPFISENGGAVFIPQDPFPLVIELGGRYAKLIAELDDLSRALAVPIRAFHSMTPHEIAEATGLPLHRAELAAAREYDEPFSFVNPTGPDTRRFLEAIEARGLSWTQGGRFYHLLDHQGKHRAVETLTGHYRRANPNLRTAGLGDSANDVALLSAVDIPILVPKPDGQYDQAVLDQLPAVRRAPHPGPKGWNAAVQALLTEHGIPSD